MVSIKRSSDLERQRAIQDFEVLLHQREAEAAAANERTKIVHLRKDLQAMVKCAKAVMRAKYHYRVAVQEARAVRCNELEEAETAYSEALCENMAVKSLHCTTLHREHAKYMSKLEEQALEVENRSWQDFLSTHLAVLCHCSTIPQRRSTFFLQYLTRELIIITSIHSICQDAPGTGVTTCDYFSHYFSQVRTHTVSPVKKASFLDRCPGRHIHWWELPHDFAGRTIELQEREDYCLVFLSKAHSCRHLQPGLQSHKRGQRTLLCHSPLGLGSQQHGWSLWHFQGTCPRHWFAGQVHPWNTNIMEWTRGIEACQLHP